MRRQFRRILTQWQNAWSDLGRSIHRNIRRTGDSVRGSAQSARSALGDVPGEAGSVFKRAIRSIPVLFQKIWHAIASVPNKLSTGFQQLGRTRRDVADSVKTTVRGAQVKAQEQPADVSREIAGMGRRIRSFIWDRPVWARVLMLLILAVLVTSPFTAKPAYRLLINWRAEQLAKRSIQMASEGRSEEAFNTANAAFLLNRKNQTVLDNVAFRAQAIDHAQALEYLSLAVNSDNPSPEIVALYVQESIRQGDLAQARPYLTWLQNTDSNSATTVALGIRYFIAEGRVDEALEDVRAAVSTNQIDTELLALYAALTLDGTPQETADEGLQFLRTNAVRDDNYGRVALRILLSNEAIDLSDRTESAEKLLKHPLKDRDDQLLAYSTLTASGSTSYEDISDRLEALFDLEDAVQLRDFGRWLLANGLYDQVLSILPREKAIKSKDFFQIYLTAMLESGHGSEMLELLSSGVPVPLSPVERLIYQAGVQRSLGLDESFESAAGLAIARAEVRDFAYLQRAIEYFGNDTLMLDFFQRVSRDPRFALLGKSRLLELAYRLNRSDIVDPLVSELRLPDLRPYPQPQNTLTYLKLLKGEEIDEARRIAETLVARYPKIIDYRVTLALAYIRSGNTEAAREVLDPSLAERSGFREGWKPVVVALLAGLDRFDPAIRLAESIRMGELSASESEFLASLNL